MRAADSHEDLYQCKFCRSRLHISEAEVEVEVEVLGRVLAIATVFISSTGRIRQVKSCRLVVDHGLGQLLVEYVDKSSPQSIDDD